MIADTKDRTYKTGVHSDSIQEAFPAVGVASAVRRDLPPHRFGEARARVFLLPREAEEEARELDAVVERRGGEVVASKLPVERRGDGVYQRDYSGHDRNPRVAEGVHGLVAPSRK